MDSSSYLIQAISKPDNQIHPLPIHGFQLNFMIIPHLFLLKGVGSGSPPGQEDGQAQSLDELGGQAHADCVERSLLDKDLRDVLQQVSQGLV